MQSYTWEGEIIDGGGRSHTWSPDDGNYAWLSGKIIGIRWTAPPGIVRMGLSSVKCETMCIFEAGEVRYLVADVKKVFVGEPRTHFYFLPGDTIDVLEPEEVERYKLQMML